MVSWNVVLSSLVKMSFTACPSFIGNGWTDTVSLTAALSSTILSKNPYLGYVQWLVGISFSNGDQHHMLTLSKVQTNSSYIILLTTHMCMICGVWSNCMHTTVIRMWLTIAQPQATGKSIMYSTHRNCESGSSWRSAVTHILVDATHWSSTPCALQEM